MKNKEVIEILDNINNLICMKKYAEASKYINETKDKLNAEDDQASSYIDDWVSNLK